MHVLKTENNQLWQASMQEYPCCHISITLIAAPSTLETNNFNGLRTACRRRCWWRTSMCTSRRWRAGSGEPSRLEMSNDLNKGLTAFRWMPHGSTPRWDVARMLTSPSCQGSGRQAQATGPVPTHPLKLRVAVVAQRRKEWNEDVGAGARVKQIWQRRKGSGGEKKETSSFGYFGTAPRWISSQWFVNLYNVDKLK
jgi:hypothetical protein